MKFKIFLFSKQLCYNRRKTGSTGTEKLLERPKMRKNTGFTLLEICIALAVMGILVVAASRAAIQYVEKSRAAEAYEVLSKCYRGIQVLREEDEEISATHPITWSRLGMSNPNLEAERFFDYSTINNDGDPIWMYADRIGTSGWVRISLSTGQIEKSAEY